MHPPASAPGLHEWHSASLAYSAVTVPWKVAWITGASSGIGAEIARQLAEAGVKVAASARKFQAEPVHPNIMNVPVDVTSEAAAITALRDIESRLGPVDLAVFAAGAYEPYDPKTSSNEHFTRINSVNYLGSLNTFAAVLPSMKQRGGRENCLCRFRCGLSWPSQGCLLRADQGGTHKLGRSLVDGASPSWD